MLYLQLLWADIFQHITDLEVDLHLLKQAQVGYFGSYYFSQGLWKISSIIKNKGKLKIHLELLEFWLLELRLGFMRGKYIETEKGVDAQAYNPLKKFLDWAENAPTVVEEVFWFYPCLWY